MTDKEPELDYWMLEVLDRCVKTEIKMFSSRWGGEYVKNRLEGRNEWDKFGQLQVIRDRLNEMRMHVDMRIKDALVRAARCQSQ